jgi:hypothetical protein
MDRDARLHQQLAGDNPKTNKDDQGSYQSLPDPQGHMPKTNTAALHNATKIPTIGIPKS